MNETELKQRCDWVQKRNKHRMEVTGEIDPDFYFGKTGSNILSRFHSKALGPLMNNDSAKEKLFNMIRLYIEHAGFDCVLSAIMAKSIKISTKESQEKLKELAGKGFEEIHAMGHEIVQMIMVTGQTPDLTVISAAPFHEVPWGILVDHTPKIDVMLTSQFSGRLKMFGTVDPQMTFVYGKMKEASEKIVAMGLPSISTMISTSSTDVDFTTEKPEEDFTAADHPENQDDDDDDDEAFPTMPAPAPPVVWN